MDDRESGVQRRAGRAGGRLFDGVVHGFMLNALGVFASLWTDPWVRHERYTVAGAFGVGAVTPFVYSGFRELFIDRAFWWVVGVPLASGCFFGLIAALLTLRDRVQNGCLGALIVAAGVGLVVVMACVMIVAVMGG